MNAVTPSSIVKSTGAASPAVAAAAASWGAGRAADTSQLGEISAAWQITPETLLVLGWRQEAAAAEGSVTHQQPGAQRGRYRSVSWPSAAVGPGTQNGAQHFVSALQLPAGEAVRAGETLLLTGQAEAAGVLARLPARFLGTTAFGVELARLAGVSAIAVTRFLLKIFAPAATRGNADVHAMLHAFLERASTPDGCIELAGAIEDHGVILQGWGAPPGPDRDVILIGPAIEHCSARLALFSRADLRGNAAGQVIVLPPAAAHDLPQLQAVVLLDRRGMRWRPMIKERSLLADKEMVAHLRPMLPGYQCDAGTRAALQASLRPRYEGRFTLYDGGHPARIAVDLAAAAPGAGTYLTGWLYDPVSVVAEVHLRGTRGGSARLDLAWTRIVREDVTDAFRADTVLPRPESGQQRHGFAIGISSLCALSEDASFYLDISFRDGRCGFVPLTISTVADEATRARLLASVDLHKPSGMQIIEGHLGPFFGRLAADSPTPKPTVVAAIPAAWTTAIVVPLADATPPRALLSQFLRAPLAQAEGVVFVCGETWTDAAAEALRTLAAFYGVTPALLRTNGAVTAAVALAAVAAVAVSAKHLLLLDPGTVGRSPGWRAALQAALAASGGMACVSPTVVYEDESIRFSGTDGIEKLDVTPYVRIKRRLAGMPASLIATVEPQPSMTASLACCLLPREAIRQLGPAIGLAATSSMQEADLFLQLRRNGVHSIWTPAAQVYAADRPSPEICENGGRVGRLIDGWCMRARLAAEL